MLLSLLYNEEIFEYYAAIVDVDRLPVFQLDGSKGVTPRRIGSVIGIRSFFSTLLKGLRIIFPA